MTAPNSTPAHIWDVLRRLLNANKTQLAERLGITPKTLRTWEAMTEAGNSPGTKAERAASELLIATLRAANHADTHAQWQINWAAIHTIGGRK